MPQRVRRIERGGIEGLIRQYILSSGVAVVKKLSQPLIYLLATPATPGSSCILQAKTLTVCVNCVNCVTVLCQFTADANQTFFPAAELHTEAFKWSNAS